MQKNVQRLLTICLISLTSCSGATIDLNWYAADHVRSEIISEDGTTIKADEPRFDNFSCLDIREIKRLAKFIRNKCQDEE